MDATTFQCSSVVSCLKFQRNKVSLVDVYAQVYYANNSFSLFSQLENRTPTSSMAGGDTTGFIVVRTEASNAVTKF